MIKLTLVTSAHSTHANLIIYDKQKNILERFEPYGNIPYLDAPLLDSFIEELGKNNIKSDLTYYGPKDIFGTIGFQTISNDSNIEVRKLGDPAGFCLAWTFWYLEMRLNNPEVNQNTMIKKSLSTILKDNEMIGEQLFIGFIRNYASQLDKLKNDFMKYAGILNKDIYNVVLSQSDQYKVIKLLSNELNKIAIERY